MKMNPKYIFIAQFCLILITYSFRINAQSPEFNSSPEMPIHQNYNSENIIDRNFNSEMSLHNLAVSNISTTSINLFGNIGNNFLDSFKGDNIYYHLAAIASTALIVNLNADYYVENYFNQNDEFGKWSRPVIFSGMFLPFIAGGSLFAYSKIKNDDETLGASYAVFQASLIELLYNSALKAITGRPGPNWRNNNDMESLSKTFRFGFLRGGIFWGWPSGHTSTTMAVVSALTNYYPDKTWLKIVGYTLVGYTIFGVSSINRGGMHWFSDAVAAALMAYAVGSTVGKYYRNIYNLKHPQTRLTPINPIASQSMPLGFSFSLQF